MLVILFFPAHTRARSLALLFAEPLLFAAHYAAIGHRIPRVAWPDDIADRLDVIGTRYQAHDAVLKLMDTQIHHVGSGRTNARSLGRHLAKSALRQHQPPISAVLPK